MTSHDWHAFLEDMIGPTFRGILPKEVYKPLVKIGLFFKQLCPKTLKLEVLDRLENNIRIFPSACVDIIIHLPIHLANEARIAETVPSYWIYPFER